MSAVILQFPKDAKPDVYPEIHNAVERIASDNGWDVDRRGLVVRFRPKRREHVSMWDEPPPRAA